MDVHHSYQWMFFSLSPNDDQCDGNHQSYQQKWKEDMKDAYEITRENANKAGVRSKRLYDSKLRYSTLLPGYRVLVRNLTPCGVPGKLRRHWEDVVRTVVHQVSKSIPVYELKTERGKGRSRTLHRNILLPCDHLSLETSLQPSQREGPLRDQLRYQKSNQKRMTTTTLNVIQCHASRTLAPDSLHPERTTQLTDQEDNQPEEVLQKSEPEDAEVNQPPEDDKDQVADQPVEVSLPSPRPPASPAHSEPNKEVTLRPRHESRKPKVFTYDKLGTPVVTTFKRCHSTQNRLCHGSTELTLTISKSSIHNVEMGNHLAEAE